MNIWVINGPNLNMLGYRNFDQYGKMTLSELNSLINFNNGLTGSTGKIIIKMALNKSIVPSIPIKIFLNLFKIINSPIPSLINLSDSIGNLLILYTYTFCFYAR